MSKLYLTIIAALLLFYSLILPAHANPNNTVHVAVASNFTLVLKEIGSAFTKMSGHEVLISSAATGQLYAQIIQGAPFDIFLAADAERPILLEQNNKSIKDSRFTYAVGQLALFFPNSPTGADENWFKHAAMQKFTIANPKIAPYGKAAMQYLQTIEQWGLLQEKLVFGQTIAQSFHYIESGNVDAGLVALSLLKQRNTDSFQYFIIPSYQHAPIEQQAVLLQDKSSAKQFMKFLKSKTATDIIINAGYGLE